MNSGITKIDGYDINEIGIKQFRNKIATVIQYDGLLSGTISENISFFQKIMIKIELYCVRSKHLFMMIS